MNRVSPLARNNKTESKDEKTMTRHRRFPDIHTDMTRAKEVPDTPQTRSPTYSLAIDDKEFLSRDELRGADGNHSN